MELRKYVGHKPLLSIGATIIVTNNHGQILLNLRSDTKTWGIPGGAMELGETNYILSSFYIKQRRYPEN